MESQEPSDSPNNTQTEFAVGALFVDRYEIESVLGVGGMGKIYRAMHKFMRRTIAIKILHTNLVDNVIALTRFRQEAEMVSRLNHPNIVAIHDFGLSPRAYLVMDFLDGTSLGELLETETHLSPMRSLPIFLQLCDGLTHAHQNGIVHRDLKPSNIMLTTNNGQQDFVKIVDFGIAKLLASALGEGKNLTLTGEVFGSPLYMSPEQCRAKPLDGRSDIYSLGCVMYRTLSGRPPVSGEQLIELLYNHVNSQPPAFSDVCPELGIPEALETIILKCMEKAPENRFQSTQELKDALLAFSLDYNADTESAGQAVIGFPGLKKKKESTGSTGKVRALRLVTNPPERGTDEVDRAAKAAEESRAASAAEAGYAATAAEERLAASYAEAGRAASAAEESLAAAAAETGRAFDAAESARAISAAEVSRAIAAAEAARATSAAEAGRVASAVESERAASAVEAELAASAKEASLAAAAAEAKRAAQATESGGIASPAEMGAAASAAELGRSTSAAEAKRAASAAETARATSASEVGLAAQATEAAFAASAQEALMVASAREAGLAASASESRRVATAAEASRAASAAESVRAASAAESERAAAAAESGRAATAAETSRVQSVAESGRAQSAAQAIKADSAPRKDETNDCSDDDYQNSNVARS